MSSCPRTYSALPRRRANTFSTISLFMGIPRQKISWRKWSPKKSKTSHSLFSASLFAAHQFSLNTISGKLKTNVEVLFTWQNSKFQSWTPHMYAYWSVIVDPFFAAQIHDFVQPVIDIIKDVTGKLPHAASPPVV